MASRPITFTFVISIISQLALAQGQPDYDANWPQWRGPLATGEAPAGNLPLEWSETKNVKWKVEIPGRGHSTPIIWGEKVFILTAVETNEKAEKPADASNTGRRMPARTTENILDFKVMALNRADGSLLWEKSVAKEAPADGTHETGSWASNSPVTDGEHLYAYFGSRGLYCMDFDGNVLWQRDFGQMSKKMSFGEGSSPALYKDRIVVLWDHEGDSYLYILDKKTGKDIMKIARDEATSWSSPLIVELNGRAQVITSATTNMRSYDLESGEIIWKGTGMTANVIPHPIESNGVLYLMSGFRGSALMAIDLAKARGDIDGTDAILWEYNKNTAYTPSALLANGKLYFLRSNNGNLTCLDASNGKEHYSLERLDGTGTIFASPVGADGRIYITSQSGISYVVRQGSKFEILAKNELDDGNFSSPAIVGNELFIRGFKYLYCITEK